MFTEDFQTPADVGLKSPILNEIVYSLPKLRPVIKEYIDVVNIDQAKEGSKELMWQNPDRFPGLVEAAEVCYACLICIIWWIYFIHRISIVLRWTWRRSCVQVSRSLWISMESGWHGSVRKSLHLPSLEWTNHLSDEVGRVFLISFWGSDCSQSTWSNSKEPVNHLYPPIGYCTRSPSRWVYMIDRS